MGSDVELVQTLQEQNKSLVEQSRQFSKQSEQLKSRLAFEGSLWQSEENKTERIMRGDRALQMHAIELADGIIGDPVHLCSVTGCTRESFRIPYWSALQRQSWPTGTGPCFWEDDAYSSDVGNRCKLHIRHALPAELTSPRIRVTQYHLAATFDGDL